MLDLIGTPRLKLGPIVACVSALVHGIYPEEPGKNTVRKNGGTGTVPFEGLVNFWRVNPCCVLHFLGCDVFSLGRLIFGQSYIKKE